MKTYDPRRGNGPLEGLPTHAEKATMAYAQSQRITIQATPAPIVVPRRKRAKRKMLRHGVRCRSVNTSYIAGTITLLATVTKGGWKALKILRSGLVPPEVLSYRNAICHACPHASQMEVKKKVVHFCNCCPCGPWSSTDDGAEIEAKNTHVKNMCPENPPRFGEYAGEPITKKRSFIAVIPSLIRAASAAVVHGSIAIRRDLRRQR